MGAESLAQLSERIRSAVGVVIHRRAWRDSDGPRLGERILVGAEVHKRPAVLLALEDQVLDVRLGVRMAGVLLAVRQDDHSGNGVALEILDSLTDRIQQRGGPARRERLTGQWLDLSNRLGVIRLQVLVVKLNKREGPAISLLLIHKGVEAADGVVPARLHRSRAVEEEDPVHSYFLK